MVNGDAASKDIGIPGVRVGDALRTWLKTGRDCRPAGIRQEAIDLFGAGRPGAHQP